MADIMTRVKQSQQSGKSSDESKEAQMQRRADRYNKVVGNLPGYDCDKCLNKGHIAIVQDGLDVMVICSCTGIRENMWRMEKSGVASLLNLYTFEHFKVNDEWQRLAKTKAEQFVKSFPHSEWLFMGGQVGAGKTHLCTAAVGQFLNMGKAARYMLWRDDSTRIKAIINNDEEYAAAVTPLKTAEVLYIDDFFKTESGKSPTTADINLAFELLNYRYINRNLVTIISSELLMDDLIDIDQAVGSRIYELSKANYCVQIGYAREKNFRLR